MKGCWKHTFPSKKYSQIDVDHVAYCKLTILVKFIVRFAVEMQTINEILMVQQGRIAVVFLCVEIYKKHYINKWFHLNRKMKQTYKIISTEDFKT